jgi:hypothetical protein
MQEIYWSECTYPLSPEAYDQIKQDEEKRFIEMEKKYTDKLTNIENTLEKLLLMMDIQKLT